MNKLIVITLTLIVVMGCATKRYTIATPLSNTESSLLDCNDLKLEMVRAGQIQNQINETGEGDFRTVVGFLGDFGIGNGMAKAEAQKALDARELQIREAMLTKGCTSDVTY